MLKILDFFSWKEWGAIDWFSANGWHRYVLGDHSAIRWVWARVEVGELGVGVNWGRGSGGEEETDWKTVGSSIELPAGSVWMSRLEAWGGVQILPTFCALEERLGRRRLVLIWISLSRGAGNEQMNVLVCLEPWKSWSGDRDSEVVNDFPRGLDGKASVCKAGELVLIFTEKNCIGY